MSKTKKELTPMERITSQYETFIKGKKVNIKREKVFENTLKKAVNIKLRSAK